MEKAKNFSNANQPRIAVMGAGIMGLACVAELIEAGYDNITMYAENITPYTTSDVAAAICEIDKVFPEPENTWYQNTLNKWNQLLSIKKAGVSKINYREVYKNGLTNNYVYKQEKNIFLINSKQHIHFIMNMLFNKKISIHKGKITSIHQLTNKYDIIINCTGLGSRELFNDQNIYPVRGQVVILSKPNELNECITELTENPTAIIPRDDDCVLGVIKEINTWNTVPDEKTTHHLIENAQKIYPALKNEKILDVKVGLRPVRNKIRLEAEKIDQSLLVHNYGHGGEGYSFAWGCAKAVINILKEKF